MELSSQTSGFRDYATSLTACLQRQDWQPVGILAGDLAEAWREGRQVFICGNGGSAANALHWANDLLYAVSPQGGKGVRISALSANSSTLTCLANDLGYERIFSTQLATQGRKGDLLIVMSGSGNSPNIIKALEQAKDLGMKSFAILGYSGGASLQLADVAIHFPVDDMQLSEDMQLVVGHMILKALHKARGAGEI